jgi:hypothetical protein
MPGFDSVVDTTEFGRDLKPRINAVALPTSLLQIQLA